MSAHDAAMESVAAGEAPNPAPAPTFNPNPNTGNQVRQLQDQRRSPQRPGLPAGGAAQELAAMEVRLASLN